MKKLRFFYDQITKNWIAQKGSVLSFWKFVCKRSYPNPNTYKKIRHVWCQVIKVHFTDKVPSRRLTCRIGTFFACACTPYTLVLLFYRHVRYMYFPSSKKQYWAWPVLTADFWPTLLLKYAVSSRHQSSPCKQTSSFDCICVLVPHGVHALQPTYWGFVMYLGTFWFHWFVEWLTTPLSMKIIFSHESGLPHVKVRVMLHLGVKTGISSH